LATKEGEEMNRANAFILCFFILIATLNAGNTYYIAISNNAAASGVSKLIAGGNVVISPAGGTGIVTVTAIAGTGGGSAAGVASINGLVGIVNLLSRNALLLDIGVNEIYVDMLQASATTNGWVSSGDWSLFNSKLSQSDADLLYYPLSNPSSYITNAIADARYYGISNPSGYISSITAVATNGLVNPTSSSVDLLLASASQNGALSSTDWSAFNGKAASNYNSLYWTGTNFNSMYWIGTNYNSVYAGYTNYNSEYWTGTNYNSVYAGYTNYNSAYWTGTNYNSVYDGFTNYNSVYASYTNYNAEYWTGTNYNSVYAGFTNYNAAYWTGTNYNSVYLTSTYNSIYDAKPDSTYNSVYAGILTNYVPTVGAGTGLTVTTSNVFSLLAFTPGTGILISDTNTITATGYNSVYAAILTNYVPSISAGTGITVSTANAIAATGYNSVYDAKPSSTYNSIYAGYVPSISGGTGVSVSGANSISLIPLTSGAGIVVSSTNTVAIANSITTVNSMSVLKTVNALTLNANVVATYGTFASTVNALTFNGNFIATSTSSGTTLTVNDIYFNSITPNNGFTTIASNIISTNIISFQTIPATVTNGLALFASGNAVAVTDSSFWLVYPYVNSGASAVGTFAMLVNSISTTGKADQVVFNVPVVGASNSVGQLMLFYGENVMLQYSGVTIPSMNIIKLK
jgi:hypothetical protein